MVKSDLKKIFPFKSYSENSQSRSKEFFKNMSIFVKGICVMNIGLCVMKFILCVITVVPNFNLVTIRVGLHKGFVLITNDFEYKVLPNFSCNQL